MISTEQLIKGVGDYDDLDKLYATWLQKTPEDHVLIHGHRNLYEIGTKVNNRIFNLCSPIEFGGNLRILHIGKDDNIDVIEIPNTVYKLPQETTPSFIPKTNEEWLKMLDASKLIMKKELSGGITSYNFTRDAFKNSKWNELTCKARGLFVKDGRVVCRSYDKFFNIGEQPETEITRLRNKLAFPVNVFEKYNGFLGLLTSNPDTGELMYCSKSSNDSPHTGYLKAVVTGLKSFGLDPAKVAAYCKENNVTLVCECIDPVHDPHIVPEDEPYLILLDVIHNSFETQRTNYLKLLGIANKLCIPYKRRVRILENFTDFTTFCRNIKTQGEGYVLEDANGYMLKIKSPSYNFWKKMRSVKECMEQNRMYGWYVVKDEKYKPYYNRALEIMREMKKAGTLENASIVDIRRQVERELG